MEMVAHDPGAAKRTGVPKKVGEDFANADKKDDGYKDREHVAKKAAEHGMSPEIYRTLYGIR
jgi:hypothetical protein